MSLVSIIIPTVEGREEHLERCIDSYRSRTTEMPIEFIIQRQPTCGIAWEQGLQEANGDFIHLTADDIVPGTGWLLPMVEAVERDSLPVGLVVTPAAGLLDSAEMPPPSNPLHPSGALQYFEAPGGPDEWADWSAPAGDGYYPSIPFFSRQQHDAIGPMIASQYGGDKWIGHRGREEGYPSMVRHGPVFYHYAAQAGRAPRAEGWHHQDRLTFDLCIAFPEYTSGRLDPRELHPEYDTLRGREMAREWYQANVAPATPYWELP